MACSIYQTSMIGAFANTKRQSFWVLEAWDIPMELSAFLWASKVDLTWLIM